MVAGDEAMGVVQNARAEAAAAQAQRQVVNPGSGTMLLDGPGAAAARAQALPALGGATMVLADSSGVVAFAQQQAQAARLQALAPASAAPTPWFFWAAWATLGVGLGIVMHLVALGQKLG